MGVANSGAASMHQSTWVVLSLLMFGEIAILAFGGFVLGSRGNLATPLGGHACAVCVSAVGRSSRQRLRAASPWLKRVTRVLEVLCRAYCATELAAGKI